MKKLFVCVLALSMVFAFTAPTMATDWDFYGNFQFDTATNTLSKEVATNPVTPNYSDTDTMWAGNGISRFGGKVTKGDIYGNWEMNEAGGLRHLYGEWNFGAGKLLIGQTWGLDSLGINMQNIAGGIDNMQGASTVRNDQVRLTFGGLQIAALTPNVLAAHPVAAGNDVDVTLPRMEFLYTFSTDMFTIMPFLGWQSVDYGYGATDQTADLTSTVWAVVGKVNFGALYVNAKVQGGTNVSDFGFGSDIDEAADWNAATNKFDDNTMLFYGATVGFKMSDTITLEGHYGAISSEETTNNVKTEVTGASEYVILANIQLAPGVTVQPEYGKLNFGDTKVGAAAAVKNGDRTWLGANWVIAF